MKKFAGSEPTDSMNGLYQERQPCRLLEAYGGDTAAGTADVT